MKFKSIMACVVCFSAFTVNAQTKDVNTKNGNVVLGPNVSSAKMTFSDQLHITNKTNERPLIWGDFKTAKVMLNGKTGIGFTSVTTFPTNSAYANYNLFVAGGILTDEIRVKLRTNGAWPDYVFTSEYKLPTLEEIEAHITENGHLINVPTAEKIAADGIDVAEMATIQQEKIEELTLHLITQNKINKQQSAEIAELKALVQQLVDKK